MEKKIILNILLGSIVIFIVLYFNKKVTHLPKVNMMPWESFKDENNQTVAFGITINKSKLKDAMQYFGNEVETALFENKDKSYDLEAYFANTKIAGFSVKIILGLKLDFNNLEFFKNNIKKITKLPTSNIKYELKSNVNNELLNTVISNISVIPYTDLATKTIISHFGSPDNIIKENNNIQLWQYKNKGLEIIIDKENKEILQYY